MLICRGKDRRRHESAAFRVLRGNLRVRKTGIVSKAAIFRSKAGLFADEYLVIQSFCAILVKKCW